MLVDDKQFFAHYNPSVTMKRSFFEAHPEIADVTAPVTARVAGTPLRDRPLLDWCRELLQTVVADLQLPSPAVTE